MSDYEKILAMLKSTDQNAWELGLTMLDIVPQLKIEVIDLLEFTTFHFGTVSAEDIDTIGKDQEIMSRAFLEMKMCDDFEGNIMEINELPKLFGLMSNLEYLSIDENNLSSLPESFKWLNKLVDLNLAHNKFTEFPTEVMSLENLKYLSLGANPITNLPNLSSMGMLMELYLFYCRITKIEALPPNLVKFNIIANPIEDITPVEDCKALKELYLAYTPAKIINFDKLPKLESLGGSNVFMFCDLSGKMQDQIKHFIP